MADPAYEQAAEGLGAKLITGQREDEGAGDIPESSAGHGQERTVVWSAQVLNRGFARRTASATSDLPSAKRCRRLTLLCRLT